MEKKCYIVGDFTWEKWVMNVIGEKEKLEQELINIERRAQIEFNAFKAYVDANFEEIKKEISDLQDEFLKLEERLESLET